MENDNSLDLKKGDDSGAVSDRVKRQLLSDGFGICAEPECNNKIDVLKTRLGECAHIIPKKVGSHPREDYTTPLEDRKKEENLLYLCEMHHKIVDNPIHASLYTADLLIKWKNDHEYWVSNVKKDTPYYSAEMKRGVDELLKKFGQGLEQESRSSIKIIESLIGHARELLNRWLLNDAEVLLSQINLFLLDVDNAQLVSQAEILNAILYSRQENVGEAKRLLNQLIHDYPSKIEPMLEYVHLCDTFPEFDDAVSDIETAARELDSAHPQIILLDTKRSYDNGELVDPASLPEVISDNPRQNMQLVSLKALFCDMQNNFEKRGEAIDIWRSTLPNSPRPHLYRVIFNAKDILSNSQGYEGIEKALEYSFQERREIRKKNPLSLRDELSWTLQELKLVLSASQQSDNEDRLGNYCEKYICLVSQCYFNPFIDHSLSEFLAQIMIKPSHWLKIVERIYESKTSVSLNLSELLFVQSLRFDDFAEDTKKYLVHVNHIDLLSIFEAISSKDGAELAALLNKRNNSVFSLSVLRFMKDSDLQILLLDLLDIEEAHKTDLIYSRFHILSNVGREEEALSFVASLPIDNANIMALNKVVDVAFQGKKWNLFVAPAKKLLALDLEEKRRAQLHAELAYSLSQLGDDSGALEQAREALSRNDYLSEENAQLILHIAGQSLSLKGDINGACKLHNDYRAIPRSLALLFEEADLLIKSTVSDRFDLALSLVEKGFRETDRYDSGMFLAAFMLLVELSNAGKIELKNEDEVTDGLFVKITGFDSGWFYIGSENDCIDAEYISNDLPAYAELVGKKLSEEVEWPSTKFSGSETQHKIQYILTLPAYLSQRAHEAMESEAKIGKAPVWSIRVIKDDGTVDFENLKNFHDEVLNKNHKIFDSYVTSLLPFAFLCKAEGSVEAAIGKINSEKRGFIRCNKASFDDFRHHHDIASRVIDGEKCSIDGLAALVLAESGMLKTISQNIDFVVAPSVIRMIRELAGKFIPGVGKQGRGNFIQGRFIFREADVNSDSNLRIRLIDAANILDAHVSIPTVMDFEEDGGDKKIDIDKMIPPYFLDAFRLAQQSKIHFLSDDAALTNVFELTGEEDIPTDYSTISLVRALFDKGIVSWDNYLEYFCLLASYRYHFLSISANDMMQTLISEKKSGLVTIEPKRLELLNLGLVLSVEYGVDDDNFIRVLSEYFSQILLDDTITKELAESVFTNVIFDTFEKRDAQLVAKAIAQVCIAKMPKENWRSGILEAKFDALVLQLNRYLQHFSPICS